MFKNVHDIYACFTVVSYNATLVYKKSAILKCDVDGLTSYKPMQWWKPKNHGGEKIVADNVKFITSDQNNTLTIVAAS